MTRFGERDAALLPMLVRAARDCLADAGLPPAAVDHCYVAESGGSYRHREGIAAAVADRLGLRPDHAAAVEQTSAAGAAAVRAGRRAVLAGESAATLVVAGEKLTHLGTPELTDRVAGVTHPVEHVHGITLPAFAGLTARRYLERFDAPREALAAVAVKNHANGVDNPKAHFRTTVDEETVLASPIVADPLRLYDFCPISDGAAAVLVTTADRARELDGDRAVIAGVGGGTDTHVVHERPEPTRLRAVEVAGERAFAAAGVDAAAVDVAEVHDMFTILEPLQLEALGFAERGEGWRLAPDGVTARDGHLPVNTSGGLKAKGHPIAASGVAQVVECYRQVTGAAGPRQVEADVALACNVGGFGNCSVVTILESADGSDA